LRAVESGGNLVVAVLPDRGQPRVWLLSVPVDQAGALGRLVAAASVAIEAAEPVPSDEHDMVLLSEVRIGPGEVLRALFLDADKPDEAGLALWRVEDADGADAIFTADVVAVGLAHASELCNLVADAVVGRVQAPVGGTLH